MTSSFAYRTCLAKERALAFAPLEPDTPARHPRTPLVIPAKAGTYRWLCQRAGVSTGRFPLSRVSPKPRWCSEQGVGRFHNPMARLASRGRACPTRVRGNRRGLFRVAPTVARGGEGRFAGHRSRARHGFRARHASPLLADPPFSEPSVRTRPGFTLPVGGALATPSFAGMTGGGRGRRWGARTCPFHPLVKYVPLTGGMARGRGTAPGGQNGGCQPRPPTGAPCGEASRNRACGLALLFAWRRLHCGAPRPESPVTLLSISRPINLQSAGTI